MVFSLEMLKAEVEPSYREGGVEDLPAVGVAVWVTTKR